MGKLALAAALITTGLTLAAASPLWAQSAGSGAVDPAFLDKGQQIYADNCSGCHQAGGSGQAPLIPALAGNARLEDLGLIVGNVHSGKGIMPAFPSLGDEDIAAVATYVRNTWGNNFGGVTTDEVAALIGGSGEAAGAGPTQSIWDGVYTEEQAARGQPLIDGTCAKCHGHALNGAGQPDQPPSPAIARAGFLHRWEGKTLEALFSYLKTKMPLDNPGQLTDQEYVDVIATMLTVSKVPAGDTELPPDTSALAGIVINEKAP